MVYFVVSLSLLFVIANDSGIKVGDFDELGLLNLRPVFEKDLVDLRAAWTLRQKLLQIARILSIEKLAKKQQLTQNLLPIDFLIILVILISFRPIFDAISALKFLNVVNILLNLRLDFL